jgi:hypothetical protein
MRFEKDAIFSAETSVIMGILSELAVLWRLTKRKRHRTSGTVVIFVSIHKVVKNINRATLC